MTVKCLLIMKGHYHICLVTEKITSFVGIWKGLSVLGVVSRDPGDDDDPVRLVREGLVVAVSARKNKKLWMYLF